MRNGLRLVGLGLVVGGVSVWMSATAPSQEPASAKETVAATSEPPPVPQGVEVLARGPVHEAFATPTSEPVATKPVPKKPPQPLEEMPPEEKPEGDVVWVSGYWAWDDDRNDFL